MKLLFFDTQASQTSKFLECQSAMSARARKSLFLGTFIHSKNLEELEFLHDAAVFVDEQGVIVTIESGCDQSRAERDVFPKIAWSREDVSIQIAKPGQFYFPGFIG